MELQWLGHSCFRIRGRDSTIVTDPPARSTGYALSALAADVVTVSHQHPGHNAVEGCTGEPRVIEGPGEYEVAGVLIDGVSTFHDNNRGQDLGRNTVYVIEVEDLRICHLGDLGHVPTAEQSEAMGEIDVLLVPVGGHNTIDAAAAAEVVSQLEPKVVVPMHYRTDVEKAELDSVEPFLKQMGLSEIAPQPRLTLTASTLPSQTQVVVLEPRR